MEEAYDLEEERILTRKYNYITQYYLSILPVRYSKQVYIPATSLYLMLTKFVLIDGEKKELVAL